LESPTVDGSAVGNPWGQPGVVGRASRTRIKQVRLCMAVSFLKREQYRKSSALPGHFAARGIGLSSILMDRRP